MTGAAVHVPAPARWSRAHAIALLGVLALAALLRLVGLGWGLRHRPHWDERVFVESAVAMVAAGDFDHRFYEYPGLFIDLAAVPLALRGAAPPAGPPDYLITRGLVAGAGIVAVAFAAWLASRLGGPTAGVLAALFLAVSTGDVATAHMVRPDVVLQALVLLTMVMLLRGSDVRAELAAGAALGAAAAVKLTGVFLLPSYLVRRLTEERGMRVRPALLAAAAALAVLLLSTPYVVLRPRAYLSGQVAQTSYFYPGAPRALGERLADNALYYGSVVVRCLGPAGAGLALVGIAARARDRRTWPLLAHVLVTVGVLSTAHAHQGRQLVPVVGTLAVFAALGVIAVGAGRGWRVAALATVCALPPLLGSLAVARGLSRPDPWDQVASWLSSHAAGARVLSSEPDLSLDDVSVVPATGFPPGDALLACAVDYVVLGGSVPVQVPGLETVMTASRAGPEGNASMVIARCTQPPRLASVPLRDARLDASESPQDVSRVADGTPATVWRSASRQRPGQWIEVALPAAVTLSRVELLPGRRAANNGRDLQLWIEEGGQWRRVRVFTAVPPVDEQAPPPRNAWVFSPITVQRLRVVQAGRARQVWDVGELTLFTPAPAP